MIDGVHGFLGAHNGINYHDRRGYGGSDSSNSGETVDSLWKTVSLVDHFVPCPWKHLRKSKCSA